MSDQKFAAIPTVYKGVQFRSRRAGRRSSRLASCPGSGLVTMGFLVESWDMKPWRWADESVQPTPGMQAGWDEAGNLTQYKSPRKR